MEYSIVDDISFSAYQAIITFDEPVSQYKTDDDFQLIVYDEFNNHEIVIDNTNYNNYGLTDCGGDDIEQWENDSFIANGGILFYFINSKQIFFKLLARCLNNYGKAVGYNTSKVKIYFNDEKGLEADFVAQTWPRVRRSREILQLNSGEDDPILSANNIRAVYDPVTKETNGFDFDAELPNEVQGFLNKNFEYESTSAIYVNTNPVKECCEPVPVYYSEVSAFYTPVYDDRSFDYELNHSILLDSSIGVSATIEMLEPTKDQANLVFPIYKHGEYVCDYTCDVDYNLYTQILNKAEAGKFKNRLYLGVGLGECEVVPGTIPDDSEKLYQLKVALVTVSPDSYILRGNNTGTAVFTITNPNAHYRTPDKLIVSLLDGSIEGVTITVDKSNYATDGIAIVTVTNIALSELVTSGYVGIEAWLAETHPAYSDLDKEKAATKDKAKTLNFTWYEEVKPARPSIENLKIVWGNITYGQTTVPYTQSIIPDDTAVAIEVTIKNPNKKYLETLENNVRYTITGSNQIDTNIVVSALDKTHYVSTENEPYVTFTVSNITQPGTLTISADIDATDTSCKPAITSDWMKEQTADTKSLTFKSADDLLELQFEVISVRAADSTTSTNHVIDSKNKPVTAIIKCINPNIDDLLLNQADLKLTVKYKVTDTQVETTITPTNFDWTNYVSTATSPYVTFEIPGLNAGGILSLTGYIDTEYETYTKEEVAQETLGSLDVEFTYISRPLVVPQHLKITVIGTYGADNNQVVMNGDKPEINTKNYPAYTKIRITNPNKKYLDEDQLIITNSFDNDSTIIVSDINYDNYNASLAEPYVEYTVQNLKIGGKLTIYAYIKASDDSYDTPITEADMKTYTDATQIVEYTLKNDKAAIEDPYVWLEDYSMYTPSEIMLDGSTIYTTKNGTESTNIGIIQAAGITATNESYIQANLITNKLEFSDTPNTLIGTVYLTPDGTMNQSPRLDWKSGTLIRSADAYKDKSIPVHAVYPDASTTEINIAQNTTLDGLGYDVDGNIIDDGGVEVGENKIEVDYQDNVGLAYKSLNLYQNSTLYLYPGDYYFNDVILQNGARIICMPSTNESKNAKGCIRLWCANTFVMQDNTNLLIGNGADIPQDIWHIILYSGRESLDNDAIALQVKVNAEGGVGMMGTIIAPNAQVGLRNNAEWTGNIWAKRIELSNRAKIYKV